MTLPDFTPTTPGEAIAAWVFLAGLALVILRPPLRWVERRAYERRLLREGAGTPAESFDLYRLRKRIRETGR